MKFVSDGDIGSLNDKPLEKQFSLEHFTFYALDDTTMHIDGYIEVMMAFANKQYKMDVKTELEVDGKIQPGPIAFVFENVCDAFVKKDAWWKVFTKLWTNCPPKKNVSVCVEKICGDL